MILVSTAEQPKRSQIFNELIDKGIVVEFVKTYGDILRFIKRHVDCLF